MAQGDCTLCQVSLFITESVSAKREIIQRKGSSQVPLVCGRGRDSYVPGHPVLQKAIFLGLLGLGEMTRLKYTVLLGLVIHRHFSNKEVVTIWGWDDFLFSLKIPPLSRKTHAAPCKAVKRRGYLLITCGLLCHTQLPKADSFERGCLRPHQTQRRKY